MFIKHHSILNNQDINQNIAHEALFEAIDKISNVTGLDISQSISLLHQQLDVTASRQTNNNRLAKVATLVDSEYQFIADLFH